LGCCPCLSSLLLFLLSPFLLLFLVLWLVSLLLLVLLSCVCARRFARSLVGLLWCCSLLVLLLARLLLLRLLGSAFPSVLSVVVVRGLRFLFLALCPGLFLLVALCLVCGLLLVVAVVLLLLLPCPPFLLVVLLCLLVLLRLLVFLLSVFRVLVPRLLWLRLLCLRCCLLFLLVCGFPLVVRVALTWLFGLSLLVLLPCWCSLLPLGGLVLGVLPLPVVLLAACCLWLLALVVCWLSFLLVLVLLVLFLPVPSLVVALVRGVRLRLLSVVVVGCWCGFGLVLFLPCGLACPGLLPVCVGFLLLVAVAVAGGSVFLLLAWLLLLCSSWFIGCRCSSLVCSFVGRGRSPLLKEILSNPHRSSLALVNLLSLQVLLRSLAL
jgi:hypothetical protein